MGVVTKLRRGKQISVIFEQCTTLRSLIYHQVIRAMPSPFFTRNATSEPDGLAILHLRRDLLTPTILRVHDEKDLGYEEGKVTNTRFGSFPHSTLIGKPWGSQIIASNVNTGSRGRRPPKRKAEESVDSADVTDGTKPAAVKTAVAAGSGFIHLLPPTPESWTASLPHRTQVVYTPDYSYILHRLRARPGSTIIEAGAGSGSFTHAAARAVFNGYPSDPSPFKKRRLGRVCSFEFHAQRVEAVQEELKQHGLDGIVEATHRDVYSDGFLLGDSNAGRSPKANAIFLDLPAPWLALKHLIRNPPEGTESPLDPSSPVHICTFSPCIEQAQKTISTLRQFSWLSISMVEVNHRRIEIRRERYGLEAEGVHGANVFPKSVDEAVGKLRQEQIRQRDFRQQQVVQQQDNLASAEEMENGDDNDFESGGAADVKDLSGSTAAALSRPDAPSSVPAYELGRLFHHTERDLKTHTSYLVFAVLPCSWSEEDEQKCRQAWPSRAKSNQTSENGYKSKRQMKIEAHARRKEQALQGEQQQQVEAETPTTAMDVDKQR